MKLSSRWIPTLAVLAGALAVTACEEAFFHEPAPRRGVAVTLSYGLAPGVAGEAASAEDFDNADEAAVRIEGGGRVLFDRVVPMSPLGVDRVAHARIQVGEDEEIVADVTVELRVDGTPVLRGVGTLHIVGGSEEPPSAEIFLEPVSAGDGGAISVLGVYPLTSVNGEPLPFTTPDGSGPGCDEILHEFSVTLRADGLSTLHEHGENVRRTAETEFCEDEWNEVEVVPFRIDGETLFLEDPEDPATGTLSGGTITVTLTDSSYDGSTVTFVLVLDRAPLPAVTLGTYALTAIGGNPLPVTLTDEEGPGCDLYIPSGSLTVRADGTAAFNVVGEEVARTAPLSECSDSFDITAEGAYYGAGTDITFSPFPELDIDSPGIGTVSGTVITVDPFRFEL